MTQPREVPLTLLQRRIDALRQLKRAGELQAAAVDAFAREEDGIAATFIADAIAMLADAHRVAWGKA
jgi:hypothetical protein